MITHQGIEYPEHRLDKLYHRYISGTPLKHAGITAQSLAVFLASKKYIKLSQDGTKYIELPSFHQWSFRKSFPKLLDRLGGINEILK